MQPTTLCNLNCGYCYLPERNRSRKMSVEVAGRVAASIEASVSPITVSWHAGEPLSTGIRHFRSLLEQFEPLRRAGRVAHVVQTNAVLIDDDWIELFRTYEIELGVSIDGPAWLNQNRVDWQASPAHQRIMSGIKALNDGQCPFTAIAVVGAASLSKAKEIYTFFVELGCESLGINIEEEVGTHSGVSHDRQRVRAFWDDLFAEWRASPTLDVREFRHLLTWIQHVSSGASSSASHIEIFPCVSHDGSVSFLSPEFVGAKSARYDDFVVGNVQNEGILDMISRANMVGYVADYSNGVGRCRSTCEFFDVCGGVSAANKYFETGSTDATETRYCINSTQEPLRSILASLTSKSLPAT